MASSIVVQFVERKLSIDEFLEELYSNKEIEKLLSENISLSPFKYLGETAYLYLLEQDLNTPGGLLNALSVLEEFLNKKDIPFEKNDEADRFYSLLLKVQPSWLDIPNWYMKRFMEMSSNMKIKEIEVLLRKAIKTDFRVLNKPPRWIQSPEWIYIDEVPIIFIGQVDISGIKYDTAQLYIFYDDKLNSYHFLEQFR